MDAVADVAGVVPDGLVDDLEPHAVGAPLLPLRLTLERDVLLCPVEDIVLHDNLTFCEICNEKLYAAVQVI